MPLKTKTKKLIRTASVAICACFLAVAYFMGTLPAEVWHDIVHAHEQAPLHTVIQEKDPCHRSIYHHDKASGCQHKTHLTGNKKCCFSVVTINTAQLISSYNVPTVSHADSTQPIAQCHLLVDTILLNRSSRAPPVS